MLYYKNFILIMLITVMTTNNFFVFLPINYIYSFLYWNNNNFSIVNFQIIFVIFNFGSFIAGIWSDIIIKKLGYCFSIFCIVIFQGSLFIFLSFSKSIYAYYWVYFLLGVNITYLNIIYTKLIILNFEKEKNTLWGLNSALMILSLVVINTLSVYIINPKNLKPNYLYKEGEYQIYWFNKSISDNVPNFLLIYGFITIIYCGIISIFLKDPKNTDIINKYPNFIFNNKHIDIKNNNNEKLIENNNNIIDIKNKYKIAIKSYLFITVYISYLIFFFGYIYYEARLKEFGFEFYKDKFILKFTTIIIFFNIFLRVIIPFYMKKKIVIKMLILGHVLMLLSILFRIIFNNGFEKYILSIIFIFISNAIFVCGFFILPNLFFSGDILIKIYGILSTVFFMSTVLNLIITKLYKIFNNLFINYIILLLFIIPVILLNKVKNN